MPPEDGIRTRHMIDAVRNARQFMAARKRSDLDTDTMLLFAVVQALHIVGEAASRILPETRSVAPSVPWAQIVGMRNRLVHVLIRGVVWKR